MVLIVFFTGGHADYWLSCPQFNMADIQIGVLMRRLKWLGYTQQSFQDGKHPHLEKYFQVGVNEVYV